MLTPDGWCQQPLRYLIYATQDGFLKLLLSAKSVAMYCIIIIIYFTSQALEGVHRRHSLYKVFTHSHGNLQKQTNGLTNRAGQLTQNENVYVCVCVSTLEAINYIYAILNLYNQLNKLVAFTQLPLRNRRNEAFYARAWPL